MFLINVLILCWVLMFHRMHFEIDALIMYDPRIRYYSYNELARQARGGYGTYGRYYDQDKIKIYSKASAKQPKELSYSPSSSRIKTQSPIQLSFQPLGALKLHSLTRGEIEFKPEALNNVFSSTASMVPDFNQYIPNLSSLYGTNEPSESSEHDQSQEEPSRPRNHHRNSDQDDASEENDRSPGDYEDHSEDKADHKSDHNKELEDDEDNAAEERDDSGEDRNKSKYSRSSEQKNDFQDDENEPASENKKNSNESNSKENSKEVPEIDPEIPIEDLPAQEGYVDKFMKYYSYAKPIAKAATFFVPGLGQYKALMFGVEMATLAYDTATIYQKGEGYASMGWHLGKEALKRLGRRSEPLETLEDPDTKKSSIDTEEFLNQVKITQYPALDEEKEQQIKSSVTEIVRKYFHDQKEYKNETERTKFIDLMVSCVKFIALQFTTNHSSNE